MGNYWSDDWEEDENRSPGKHPVQQQRLEEQTESLPVPIRNALVESVVETLVEDHGGENVQELLAQVEQEIQDSQTKIDTWQSQQAYLATRIAKYQQALLLSEEKRCDNQNKQALGKVMDIRFTFLLHIKTYQRKVESLQEKRTKLQRMAQECKDFVVLAAIDRQPVNNTIQETHQNDDDDHHDAALVVLPQHIDTKTQQPPPPSCLDTMSRKEDDLEMGGPNVVATAAVTVIPPMENQ